jgi:hypothetical protein
VQYQLKITLNHTEPAIWRRILVPSDLQLSTLHYVIQLAMGWGNDHLYNFKIGKRIIDGLTPMGDVLDNGGDERPNANEVALSEVAKRVGSKLEYEYDFGDCWIHQIVVEKRVEDGDAKDGKGVITCIDGEGACPLEDCGGVYAYYRIVYILSAPDHPEYERTKEWWGWYEAKEFDLAAVNAKLLERFS